jgi:hypothetical protein
MNSNPNEVNETEDLLVWSISIPHKRYYQFKEIAEKNDTHRLPKQIFAATLSNRYKNAGILDIVNDDDQKLIVLVVDDEFMMRAIRTAKGFKGQANDISFNPFTIARSFRELVESYINQLMRLFTPSKPSK